MMISLGSRDNLPAPTGFEQLHHRKRIDPPATSAACNRRSGQNAVSVDG
jgi:hypothetical protein